MRNPIMSRHIFIIILAAILLIASVQAVPTTGAASLIGNNNFTLSATGCTGTCWFQWSFATGQAWAHTPNQTPATGAISYTMKGTPVFGSTKYYFRACDASGCGAEQSFTTIPVVTVVIPTFDQYFQNMTENNFDLANAAWNFTKVYTDVTGATFFYGLLLAMLFGGMWLRTKGTQTATILGMIMIGLFASSAAGLQLGLPPAFLAVGQALMYLSLAGAVMMFAFK
jgi:hypothetical protein